MGSVLDDITQSDPLINRTISDYRIESRIGEGGTSVVYRAVGLHDKNIQVAVKVIKQGVLGDKEKLAAFKKEAMIQKVLDHPNVLKTFEYLKRWSRPAIIMEYFPGKSLRYLMTQKKDALRPKKIGILHKAAQALAYIHKKGIIHQDIKPENLLVADDWNVKLIDFSLSKSKLGGLLSFLWGRRHGTPTYMSPEQILRKVIDNRSDIYSFGIVMYELLAETLPFTANHPDELFIKHLKESPRPLRKVNEQVPKELEAVVEKMLAKKPSERYDNMDQIVYVLGRLLSK